MLGEDLIHKALSSRSFGGVKVTIQGDLNTLNRFMGLDTRIGTAVRQAQMEFLKRYRKALIKNFIEGGASIGIFQDSEDYLKKKIKKGYDPMAGNLTHSLRESISIIKKGSTAFVGIPRNTERKYYPINMMGGRSAAHYSVDEYAEILENGSSQQPARPFFKETFRKTMGGTNGLGKFIRRSIAQRLRRL